MLFPDKNFKNNKSSYLYDNNIFSILDNYSGVNNKLKKNKYS